jgi:lipopolysaccharide transport system ATP-binding protein
MTNLAGDTVIQCTNLGKCYQIYDNPKARLKQALWRGSRQYFREFWALRHVDFEVQHGDSLGIIGRNGSGKSTLLQLICGTLTPTEGSIKSKGRIAALLELGSGFNPEFTGIENVYLNASMLGLSKEETDARLEDILAFADINDFAYQPVKTYSSGMAVRLAFAVIAHVDADILVVDEALSVGDAFFNQKCMRFINRFTQDKCLLFVSHDAGAITTFCGKALMLKHGRTEIFGTSKTVIDLYIKEIYSASQDVEASRDGDLGQPSSKEHPSESQSIDYSDWIDYRVQDINASSTPNLITVTQFKESLLTAESFGNGKAAIQNVQLIESASQKPIHTGLGGERVTLRVEALALSRIYNPIIGFLLKNDKGLTLLGDNSLNQRTEIIDLNQITIEKGVQYFGEFEFTLPLLPKGKYSFTISLAEGSQEEHQQLQWMNDALFLDSINCSVAAGLAGVPMHSIILGISSKRQPQ